MRNQVCRTSTSFSKHFSADVNHSLYIFGRQLQYGAHIEEFDFSHTSTSFLPNWCFFYSNLAIFVFDPLFFVNFVNFCVQILGNKYAKCSLNTILVVYWNGSVLEFIIRIPMLLWTIQNWVVSKPGPCSKGYKGYL